jgi:hypothetical protein
VGRGGGTDAAQVEAGAAHDSVPLSTSAAYVEVDMAAVGPLAPVRQMQRRARLPLTISLSSVKCRGGHGGEGLARVRRIQRQWRREREHLPKLQPRSSDD